MFRAAAKLNIDRLAALEVRARHEPVGHDSKWAPVGGFENVPRPHPRPLHRRAADHIDDLEPRPVRPPTRCRRSQQLLPQIEDESETEYRSQDRDDDSHSGSAMNRYPVHGSVMM